MIFCIDIGNTNIKYGVYSGDKLVASFRVASVKASTSDEYGTVVRDLLANEKIAKSQIKGVILSSVIPQLNYTISHMCEYYLGHTPLIVGPGIKTGINIKVDSPREVGADRIVNSVSALRKYGKGRNVICIDFGTATTFNVISDKGELIGGVISPGIKGSLDSLVNGTAKLPNIELEMPKSIICKNTVTNMQAGLLYGFAGLVTHIVEKMKQELGTDNVVVVATGGLSETIARETPCIDIIDRNLTLDGLKILYDINRVDND
ncbi:MAG: type III pantothenate kinase [Clostridia bacterium]|nr:type III pantothenate kinase [Clostridia bacterium]MBQ3495843.1 type III pantothenate kinase [Clostridia bacterium]MBQ4586537.1 type III pantothenate kinase [Clostridia bacterium]MBQ6883923.1 type III pantothenate kinase [Clostridia bacterium]